MAEETRFARPPLSGLSAPSPNLYVANCGPAVGVPHTVVAAAFSVFGEVVSVHDADASGARLVVCYSSEASARAAIEAWGGGRPCAALGGRILHIRYSVLRAPRKAKDITSVSTESVHLGIPGIYLLQDFISVEDEKMLLAAVDRRPWKNLAKRRVQHYGYEFLYEIRNVDAKQSLGHLPSFVLPVVEKLTLFPIRIAVDNPIVNQLTVNEYRPGVGLSPHIDTHSAFTEYIFSLSLAGSCIMEFRKFSGIKRQNDMHTDQCSDFEKKAIFLPPRCMLLMSGEGRYAWHHYIPHHKVDMVGDQVIKRDSRRVSFTFRKIREGPCCCEYPQYCDSQMEKTDDGVCTAFS